MSCGINLRAVLQELLKISILDVSWNITNSRLQLYLPGVKELILKQMDIFSKIKFQILFAVIVAFLCETGAIQSIHSQHSGY